MKIRIILFLFISTICPYAYSQVLNVDREIEVDTVFKRMKASFNFNFANDKQKKNLVDFSNASEFDYFLKNKFFLIFLSKTELSLNGLQVLENNGFFQFRFRDNDSRKIAPDIFTQYQWNGVQGMEHRALVGANARFRWLEEKKSDLYTSIGTFYEFEKWNPNLNSYAFSKDSLDIVFRDLLRLNVSAKFALKINKNIDFTGVTFVQFPLNSHFSSPRWFFDSNVFFKVNKFFSFFIHYDHNVDSYRPLPIDSYFYTISTGINLKF